MWGLGTGAIQSTDRIGVWASLAVFQGGVWGCLVLGTKTAKTRKTGTSKQRTETVQAWPYLLGPKGGIAMVVALVLPIHPIPSVLSPLIVGIRCFQLFQLWTPPKRTGVLD